MFNLRGRLPNTSASLTKQQERQSFNSAIAFDNCAFIRMRRNLIAERQHISENLKRMRFIM